MQNEDIQNKHIKCSYTYRFNFYVIKFATFPKIQIARYYEKPHRFVVCHTGNRPVGITVYGHKDPTSVTTFLNRHCSVTFLFSLRLNANVVETSSFSLAMCHNKVPNSKEYVYKLKTQTDS